VAASKRLEAWSFDGILDGDVKRGIEWHLVPIRGHQFHGQAERMSGVIKKPMKKSFECMRYSHK
jgi:hypothetical protein